MTDTKDTIDWRQWMRDFGRQQRRVREFLGMSQEEVARAAGVSQGAVSRLEGGRGLATPFLVVLKIHLALIDRLRGFDPALFTDEVRRALQMNECLSPPIGAHGFRALPLMKDEGMEELIRLFRSLPDRHRETALSVVRATMRALVPAAHTNEAGGTGRAS